MKRPSSFPPEEVGERINSLNSDEEYLKIIAKEDDDTKSTKSSGGSSRNGAGEHGVISDESKSKAKELVDHYLKDDIDGRKFNALAGFLSNPNNQQLPDYTDEDLMSFEETYAVSEVRYRVMNLEASVDAVNAKLDAILSRMMREVPTSPPSPSLWNAEGRNNVGDNPRVSSSSITAVVDLV